MNNKLKDTETYSEDWFEILEEEDSLPVVFSEEKPWIDKKVRLFTTGTHKGKPYTEADLNKIVSNFQKPKNETDWTVPLQLDHSESSRDTVGDIRDVWRKNAELQGIARFKGKEPVEKVGLGLWKKLSIGLRLLPDLKLREVSVTPFPHIEEAQVFKEESTKGDNEMSETVKDVKKEEKPEVKEKEVMKEDAMHKTETKAQAEAEQIAKMKEDFEARTSALEAKLKEQEKVLKFKECTDVIVSFMEEGRTVPAMKDKELVFVQSLTDEQMAQYKELKQSQPVFVEFKKLGFASMVKPGNENGDPSEVKYMADRLGLKDVTI